MRVGISGMGRIGRLALRAAMGAAERQGEDPRAGNRLEIVHLNEIKGGAPAIEVHYGGPVERSRGFVLHRGRYSGGAEMMQINGGFQMSATVNVVE